MLAFDLIGLAILWSIGLLALIQTINSRSAIRASLSGIITVVIFLIACVFSYLKIEGYGSFVSPELSPTSILATNLAIDLAIGNAESGTSDGKKLSSEDRPSGASSATNAIHSLERYVASAVKIADEANALASRILATKPLANDIDEATREKAESKALAIRNKTAQLSDKATSLFHPKSVSLQHQNLVRATEGLRLAGYALHAYTTMENSADKQEQFEQSMHQSATAQKTLAGFKSELDKLQQK